MRLSADHRDSPQKAFALRFALNSFLQGFPVALVVVQSETLNRNALRDPSWQEQDEFPVLLPGAISLTFRRSSYPFEETPFLQLRKGSLYGLSLIHI